MALSSVERYIEVIGELVEEMARVRAFIAAPAIVGAAHVSARSDSLKTPAIPLAVGIEADGHRGRLFGDCDWRRHDNEHQSKEARGDRHVALYSGVLAGSSGVYWRTSNSRKYWLRVES
jgi:hypothetical protein